MIPSFTASGALPPFVGADATHRPWCSPYQAQFSEVFGAFARTHERARLFAGLLAYRDALRAAGITSGFQIIDGSFTEDCEMLRGRPPSDIDVVTFAPVPVAPADVPAFLSVNVTLFDPVLAKSTYFCDAYFVNMNKPSHLLVADTAYWFGLFSHQRVTSLWKGMVQVPLSSDDDLIRGAMARAVALSP